MNNFDTRNKPQAEITTDFDLASLSTTPGFRAGVDNEILEAQNGVYTTPVGNTNTIITQTGGRGAGRLNITMPSMIASGEPAQGISLVVPGAAHTSYCFQSEGADVSPQPIISDLQDGNGPKGITPSSNPAYSLVMAA